MSRFGWPLLLLAIALVATAAQLDRQSRYDPDFAAVVPPAARGFAQYHLAAEAVAEVDARQALGQAQMLVRRRPMEAAHLTLLSRAQFMAGNSEAAFITIQHAARRGWREGAVQEAMLAIALDRGDDVEAARRYAALFALSKDSERLAEVAPQALATPAARQAVAEILQGTARWRPRFERLGPQLLPIGIHADIAARIAALEEEAR